MQDMENRSLVTLGHQITERYGLLLSQVLLAELLAVPLAACDTV